MEQSKYTPCGGCGATDPMQRCIGCFHPFVPIKTKCNIEWVNLGSHYTEDWAIMHCRYASDGFKLDTDLFEEKDGGLVKKGGAGRVEFNEVQYLVELDEGNKVANEALSAGEGGKEGAAKEHPKVCGNCGKPGYNYIGNQYYLCDDCMEEPEHL
jgi:hypothetical protein